MLTVAGIPDPAYIEVELLILLKLHIPVWKVKIETSVVRNKFAAAKVENLSGK